MLQDLQRVLDWLVQSRPAHGRGPCLPRLADHGAFLRRSDPEADGDRGVRLVRPSHKGTRWMSWRREAMKDVVTCEKLRGAGKQAEIRRCPNGATHPFGIPNPE